MKKLKVVLSIMAVMIALAGAFVTNASSKSLDLDNVTFGESVSCVQADGVCITTMGNPQCEDGEGNDLFDRNVSCSTSAKGTWDPD